MELLSKRPEKLECFQQAKLQQILCIKWQDWHTNNEVLNGSEMTSIEAVILKLLGHVTRIVLLHETQIQRPIERHAAKCLS